MTGGGDSFSPFSTDGRDGKSIRNMRVKIGAFDLEVLRITNDAACELNDRCVTFVEIMHEFIGEFIH